MLYRLNKNKKKRILLLLLLFKYGLYYFSNLNANIIIKFTIKNIYSKNLLIKSLLFYNKYKLNGHNKCSVLIIKV